MLGDCEPLHAAFAALGRLGDGKVEPTYYQKIFRSPKVAQIERADGRAWYGVCERHIDFINANVTYTEEENEKLISFAQAKQLLL